MKEYCVMLIITQLMKEYCVMLLIKQLNERILCYANN